MLNILLRVFGERALHKVIGAKTKHNPLDVKFGIAVLRDRRVAFRWKLLAFGLGVGLLALLLALEVPAEALVSLLAPILLPLGLALDGVETLALPVLFMALIVSYVAPRAIVEQIRAERLALHDGPVIDVQGYDPQVVHALPSVSLPQPTQTVVYAGSRRA